MKKEYIDCIALKRKIQRKISEETKGMGLSERLAYYQRQVETSPFSHLLRLRDSSESVRHSR